MKFFLQWVIPVTLFTIGTILMGDMVIWERFAVALLYIMGTTSLALSVQLD